MNEENRNCEGNAFEVTHITCCFRDVGCVTDRSKLRESTIIMCFRSMNSLDVELIGIKLQLKEDAFIVQLFFNHHTIVSVINETLVLYWCSHRLPLTFSIEHGLRFDKIQGIAVLIADCF